MQTDFFTKVFSLRHQGSPDLFSQVYKCMHAAAAIAAKSCQSCPTVRPHRRQPTRLPRPWDFPGKNTGVGCHCLLHVARYLCTKLPQSCLTLCDVMDYIPPDFSVHGILQARILEWVAISFSRKWQGERAAKMLIR